MKVLQSRIRNNNATFDLNETLDFSNNCSYRHRKIVWRAEREQWEYTKYRLRFIIFFRFAQLHCRTCISGL